jgi:hypothetical protein
MSSKLAVGVLEGNPKFTLHERHPEQANAVGVDGLRGLRHSQRCVEQIGGEPLSLHSIKWQCFER